MGYGLSDFEKLTDESKDVWDYIRNNSIPIDIYRCDIRQAIDIRPDYVMSILKKALDNGLISTKTRRWRDLYQFRDHLPVYLCEMWLVRMLYAMNIPIYYRYKKERNNRDWYRFYAKIKYRRSWSHTDEFDKFIVDEINEYIKTNQGGVK